MPLDPPSRSDTDSLIAELEPFIARSNPGKLKKILADSNEGIRARISYINHCMQQEEPQGPANISPKDVTSALGTLRRWIMRLSQDQFQALYEGTANTRDFFGLRDGSGSNVQLRHSAEIPSERMTSVTELTNDLNAGQRAALRLAMDKMPVKAYSQFRVLAKQLSDASAKRAIDVLNRRKRVEAALQPDQILQERLEIMEVLGKIEGTTGDKHAELSISLRDLRRDPTRLR